MTLPCHGSSEKVWKAWKAMMPASHPSHTLWKSVRGSTFPRPRRLDICLLMPLKPNHRLRKGLVTDASGPQRHTCPGALSLSVLSTSVTKQTGDTVTAERDGDNPQLWATHDVVVCPGKRVGSWINVFSSCRVITSGVSSDPDERTEACRVLPIAANIASIAAKKFRTSLA